MERHRSTYYLTFVLVATLITAGLVFWAAFKVNKGVPESASLASDITPQISDVETKTDILAPNGKMTLVVKSLRKPDGNITQNFYVLSEGSADPLEIYGASSSPDKVISIPYNTFSPDNKYIFLKVTDPQEPKYVVVRTDGKNIKGDEKQVEITSLFYEKYPDYLITEATGWGGVGLIVFNTNNKDGSSGPSFWFEVSSFSFIRLSTKFN